MVAALVAAADCSSNLTDRYRTGKVLSCICVHVSSVVCTQRETKHRFTAKSKVSAADTTRGQDPACPRSQNLSAEGPTCVGSRRKTYLCEDDCDGANERLERCSHVGQVSSGVHVFGIKSS